VERQNHPDTLNALNDRDMTDHLAHLTAEPTDTIAAISTPPGRGGIGIVRLSGPEAIGIAGRLIRLATQVHKDVAREQDHARARFAQVLDAAGAVLDEALVTMFFAPHSYTGEDLAEIAAHGSPVVLEAILRGALAAGARLAAPGEFTQRAFLAGRLDLTQAEAVQDLIAAQTLDQARVAAQQLGGALSRRVAPAKESLLHLIALLEAGMDFASGELDDVDVVPPAQIATFIAAAATPLEALAASFSRGRLLREGASIALVGPPNAGKSSLFNRLLERERAIVTAMPGTTRDTVEESLALGGVPLRLIDTAGLRDGSGEAELDEAERQGIARSREALADADIVLLVQDVSAVDVATEGAEDQQLREAVAGRPHLRVANKVDLVDELTARDGDALYTSALTGEGLDELRGAILAQLGASGSVADRGALNNLRQQEAVSAALAAMRTAEAANAAGLPHELILVDLHAALAALDSLTGTTTPDDILGRIFSAFCIGK
jgi:tRNA modification GTPase